MQWFRVCQDGVLRSWAFWCGRFLRSLGSLYRSVTTVMKVCILIVKVNLGGDHLVCDSVASEGSDVACKWFGTHTGLNDMCGSTYRSRETADNGADEVTGGRRIKSEATSYGDGLAEACDNGCGTLADAEFKIKSSGAEAATIKSYVGGKPGGGSHVALGGSYGAGVLAANVSLV